VALALCRVVESNSQRRVSFSLELLLLSDIEDEGGDLFSGFKGEGHETGVKAVGGCLVLSSMRSCLPSGFFG